MKKEISWNSTSLRRWKYKISEGKIMFSEKGKNDWSEAYGATLEEALFDLAAAVEERKLKNYMEKEMSILAALGHVVEVLDDLKPCGHSGDEEMGEHDADCMLCRVEAALEHAEDVSR